CRSRNGARLQCDDEGVTLDVTWLLRHIDGQDHAHAGARQIVGQICGPGEIVCNATENRPAHFAQPLHLTSHMLRKLCLNSSMNSRDGPLLYGLRSLRIFRPLCWRSRASRWNRSAIRPPTMVHHALRCAMTGREWHSMRAERQCKLSRMW